MFDKPQPVPGMGADLPDIKPKLLLFVEAFFACGMNASAAARRLGYKNPDEGYRLYHRPEVQAHIQARLGIYMQADEVMQRLTARARFNPDDFIEAVEYEAPVYESAPVQELIDNAHRKIEQFLRIDPEKLKGPIEAEWDNIAKWEGELALDPDATYQKQVGTETRVRYRVSLDQGYRNGVTPHLVSVKETRDGGLELKWVDQDKALELIGKHHKLFTDKVEHSGTVEGVIGIDFIMPADEGGSE